MDTRNIHQDSPAWHFFVHLSFALSLGLMCLGIWALPASLWIKGYLGMGLFFTVASTLTLAKTTRDAHEAKKLINRLSEAKTEKMLHEYELKP
ncbi:MAG: hypothetical protein JO250_23780 [Armatimonadetes bacterium]|nr:hypothetical protein [Armatimonadota bacterium]